jgi:hypothetical protein
MVLRTCPRTLSKLPRLHHQIRFGTHRRYRLFLPTQLPHAPQLRSHNTIIAATALTQAFLNPEPASPFNTFGTAQQQALQQLVNIFARSVHNPAPTPRVQNSPHLTPTPTVEPAPPPRHRYPLRSQQAHIVATVIPNNNPPLPPQQANSVIDAITGNSQEYRHLIKGPDRQIWLTSYANELGRLAQGVGKRMPTGTNTLFFIPISAVPKGRNFTYGNVVCTIPPQKAEPHRSRLVVGGDKLDYPGHVSTPTAKITTAKCLINSTISTPKAQFAVTDLKDFYLGTPMARYEYMRLHISTIPQEIIDEYKLLDIVTPDGWVYIEIKKGMYGLKQAGIIANERRTTHLAKYDYHPTPRTPGLWKHKTRPITFCLVVDDFGIKYIGQEHADHLINALQELYTCSTDWTGSLYCGLTIEWNYDEHYVDISMPNYVTAALHKFQHPMPTKPEHAPHAWNQPVYGTKQQYAEAPDTSEPLPPKAVTRIQQMLGTFLYYAIAVDSTMLVTLGTLASAQANAMHAQNCRSHHSITQLCHHSPQRSRALLRQ